MSVLVVKLVLPCHFWQGTVFKSN